MTHDEQLIRDMEEGARELALLIERSFEAWIEADPSLGLPLAQMVVFTLAAKKLAQSGTGLTPLVQQLFRAYGLHPDEIQIEDQCGDSLVNYKRQTPSLPLAAPGSLRRDN